MSAEVFSIVFRTLVIWLITWRIMATFLPPLARWIGALVRQRAVLRVLTSTCGADLDDARRAVKIVEIAEGVRA